MEMAPALEALSALAHEGRLEVFRMLVQAGPDGLAAGEIARRLGCPPNSLSANLAVLSRAGLVGGRRAGRSVIYAAGYSTMTALVGFLVEDCCGGAADVCAPLAAIVAQTACCAPPP